MAVTVLRTDGWMPQTAALDPALLMYIRYVCTHAYVLFECTDQSMCDALLLLQSCLQNRVTKRPVMHLTGKTQAVLSPSTVKQFLEANKLPHALVD